MTKGGENRVDQDTRNPFLRELGGIFARYPYLSLLALWFALSLSFTLGYQLAEKLTPPAGVRELAALEAAFRSHQIDIPRTRDLVHLIDHFSQSLKQQEPSPPYSEGPAVVISEIHADPADGKLGDANGDDVRNAFDDEFVELLNTTCEEVDISRWTISDSEGLKFTFPPRTQLEAREAAVVFGGPTPTGRFGNATANHLVFYVRGGHLKLTNSGDTVTLKDDRGNTVDSATYGSVSGESLVRDPDGASEHLVGHSEAPGSDGKLFSPGTRIDGQDFTVSAQIGCRPRI